MLITAFNEIIRANSLQNLAPKNTKLLFALNNPKHNLLRLHKRTKMRQPMENIFQRHPQQHSATPDTEFDHLQIRETQPHRRLHKKCIERIPAMRLEVITC